MKQCKCEHWQQCPTCMPHRFDAQGNRLPPEPTPLQALQAQVTALTNALFQAQEAAKATALAPLAATRGQGGSDDIQLPQGYEPHEVPADYDGPVWIEGQLRQCAEVVAAHEREACAQVCEEWGAWNNTAQDIAFAIRARGKA